MKGSINGSVKDKILKPSNMMIKSPRKTFANSLKKFGL
jgi:hypothetical protein